MIKQLSIAFCICFLGMSFIKPGLIKKIVRCEIPIYSNQIFPGNSIELEINTILKDSSLIYSSASNLTINFADYVVKFSGGISVEQKSRTKITVRILDNAFDTPFIKISAHLRRKKSIKWQIELPIRYDLPQKVVFRGDNGYDPRANTNNGYKKIPLTKHVNLEFIDNEQTLTNNSDPAIIGGKGPDLDVHISLIKSSGLKEYIQVEIRNEFGEQFTKYLRVGGGTLEIQTMGGKGGISRSGGKGGMGGNVTVFIKPNAKPYFDQIFIVNLGGEGGDLWRPKVDGQQQGAYGDNGELTIIEWD